MMPEGLVGNSGWWHVTDEGAAWAAELAGDKDEGKDDGTEGSTSSLGAKVEMVRFRMSMFDEQVEEK